jgi:hypothetical protein
VESIYDNNPTKCDSIGKAFDLVVDWKTGVSLDKPTHVYALGYLTKTYGDYFNEMDGCLDTFIPALKYYRWEKDQTYIEEVSFKFATTLYTSDLDKTGEVFNDILTVKFPSR